ncbi:unnamed protein product [Staurois parvus]|uniref:Uncharacterized protein n=1 Tax=Staurois parvus TaxID=386267 RepID=A0ABN9BG59_9NEOB|nr:unnamed protein product [Staurois parvus]
MAECGEGKTAAMGGRTGTHEDTGPGSSMRRRYGAHGRLRPGSSNGRPVICQHPMTKMEHPRNVRRPESGTWQSVAMETAAMERPYRDP